MCVFLSPESSSSVKAWGAPDRPPNNCKNNNDRRISCENWATQIIHVQRNLGLLFLTSSSEMQYRETAMTEGVSDTKCQRDVRLHRVTQ